MNREQRRQSRRQGPERVDGGAVEASGSSVDSVEGPDRGALDAALATEAVAAAGPGASNVTAVRHRVAPRQFAHEVNVELRKVAWPSRTETVNYSTVVFITLAVVMAMIFGLDLVFTRLADFLFNP